MPYPCANNVCSTCRYWLGKKVVINMGQYYDEIDEMSKCQGPFGSSCANESIYYGGCTKWEPLMNSTNYYGK